MNWSSNFYADDAKMEADLTQAYLKWVGSTASKYWRSYAGYDIGTEVKCVLSSDCLTLIDQEQMGSIPCG